MYKKLLPNRKWREREKEREEGESVTVFVGGKCLLKYKKKPVFSKNLR